MNKKRNQIGSNFGVGLAGLSVYNLNNICFLYPILVFYPCVKIPTGGPFKSTIGNEFDSVRSSKYVLTIISSYSICTHKVIHNKQMTMENSTKTSHELETLSEISLLRSL